MKRNLTISTAAIAASGLISGAASASGMTGVNAGFDQAVSLADGAYLAGSLTESGQQGMSIGWSKVDGPGEVVFERRHSAATSASFSAPGKYTLMLGGFDGYVYYDFVEVTVSP